MNAPDRGPDDELRALFRSQAGETLDPHLVHARVHTALNRRRRRRQAATAGGIALAVAGLAFGANSLDLAGGRQQDPTPAASAPTSEPTSDPGDGLESPGADAPDQPAATSAGPNEALDAFWGSGYSLSDAQALADLWSADVVSAKAVAGQRLVDGVPVPVAPDRGVLPGERPVRAVDDAQQAFWDAGYDHEDAVALGALWEYDDSAVVKAVAGQQLLDGVPLPLHP